MMRQLSDSALLARAELLWTLRDLTSLATLPGDESRLAAVAAEAAELTAAAGLDAELAQPLQAAAVAALDVGVAARRIDLATWDGAATGLDLAESAYVRRDRGAILGDIAGFYRAFGVQPGGESLRHDELGRELEFLGLLHLFAARARQDADAETAETIAAAAAAFWADHLAAWCALPAGRAEVLPVPRWLATALHALATTLTALAAANDWPPPQREDGGLADAEPEVSCAMA